MVALNKKSKQAFQIINYSLKVIEHGSDTDFGKEKMVIYNPISRSQISVDRKDFEISFEYLNYRDGKIFYQKFDINEIKNLHAVFNFDPYIILEIINKKPEIIQLSDDDVLLSYSINISNVEKTINFYKKIFIGIKKT